MGYASAVSMLLLVLHLVISFLQKVVFREKDGTKGGEGMMHIFKGKIKLIG